MCNKCETCIRYRPEIKEPLMALSFPQGEVWDRVGTDLFEFNKQDYLIVVDYTSRWFEIRHLEDTTPGHVIRQMCSIFATHGIPNVVVSDNGPQYASKEFKEFTEDWGFTHVTSSPLHPQANGEAERAVQTAKNILRKNVNPYLGMLAYRTAPLRNGLTPCELLMNRKLRTTLPTTRENLKSKPVDREALQEKEQQYRDQYTENYNHRHRTVALPSLKVGDRVFIRDQNRHGEVREKLKEPRSYKVVTEGGTTIRRNRGSLIHTGTQSPLVSKEATPEEYPQGPPGQATQLEKPNNPPTTPAKPKSPKPAKAPSPVKSSTPVKPPDRISSRGRVIKNRVIPSM